jgi:hypothetical protein
MLIDAIPRAEVLQVLKLSLPTAFSFAFLEKQLLCRWFRFAQLAKGKKSRP